MELTGAIKILLEHGSVGALLIIMTILWIRERRQNTEIAKSFNKQISVLNEKRGEEIRLMAEALQANSDNNMHLSNSMEKLRDFLVEYIVQRPPENLN